MRYVSVEYDNGQRSWGFLVHGDLIDVPAGSAEIGLGMPPDLLGFITSGPDRWAQLAAARADLARPSPGSWRLLAPIPRPRRNIIAIGRNYADHAAESGTTNLPDAPIVFSKAVDECVPPDGHVVADRSLTTKLDWEVELAVVLGRGGRSIPEDAALNHVFGYTVLNDISARDVQEERAGGQWFLGKSLEGTCPMGPAVVPADQLDAADLEISLSVNGIEKQRSNTAQMIFPVSRLVSELSRYMTLRPGDIIATGTPSGVGAARQPPEFLHPGDVVEAQVAGIGSLRSLVVASQR